MMGHPIQVVIPYRVMHHVFKLGLDGLDLESSPGLRATYVVTYYPCRMAGHPKSESIQPRSET